MTTGLEEGTEVKESTETRGESIIKAVGVVKTYDTWAMVQQAREIDVQRLLGHSTSAMLRRYTASYDAEKAAQAHASFSPGDRLGAAPVSVT
ncbi:MAG: hypothetical protein J4N92_08140 [Chloroflexi bacterium]|nr:hypothetical protein [Chloroflexota bacterium]